MEKQRLDKIVASTGKWSRREVKELVRRGQILADGAAVRSADEKFDPEAVTLTVEGEPLLYRRYTWVMLNKPAGYLSATEDGRGPTVLDLLPEELRRQGLFPVGRLDRDTEGLLIMTNDGGLAHDLLSPKKHVKKVYYVETARPLSEEGRKALEKGVDIGEEKPSLPAKAERISDTSIYLTITEGKYHQVKRMLRAVENEVAYLKRTAMGGLFLDENLSCGSYRELTEEEVRKMRE